MAELRRGPPTQELQYTAKLCSHCNPPLDPEDPLLLVSVLQYTAKLCSHCNRWVFRFSAHAKPILASFIHLALDFLGFAGRFIKVIAHPP